MSSLLRSGAGLLVLAAMTPVLGFVAGTSEDISLIETNQGSHNSSLFGWLTLFLLFCVMSGPRYLKLKTRRNAGRGWKPILIWGEASAACGIRKLPAS